MTILAVTGKVGSGKNLYAIQRIRDYAYQGRRVVANFKVDLWPAHPFLKRLLGRPAPVVERIPGRPTYEDVRRLGKGGPGEHKAGLLVLDETGPLLNARSWQDADRQKFIDWLLHSRKLAWDVLLLVQNITIIDKQIRTAVIESLVTCKRMDRLKVPVLKIPLPRVHLAIERYGTEINAPVAERTFYRGAQYFKCYDTTELVGVDDMKEEAPMAIPAQLATEATVEEIPKHLRPLVQALTEMGQGLGLVPQST